MTLIFYVSNVFMAAILNFADFEAILDLKIYQLSGNRGGGPAAVVKAACLESREIAGSNFSLTFMFQRNKLFLLCSLVMIQYCGELP